MKKYTIAITFTVIGMMFVTSCSESFLDERVKSSFAPETLADPLGFEASVVGLHRHFSSLHTYSDQQGFLSVWQLGTDIAWPILFQGIEIPYYRYAELSSQDAAASFVWTWAYKLIKNANVIIGNVENSAPATMTQAEKDAINAEARFFRAYGYNFLVTLFGDVPLTTELVTSAKTDFVRAPVSEINTLIEADLLFAATSLPLIDASALKKGSRANKAMAQQLLAEAYLRMGRPADAETQCMAIINSGKFRLVRNRYGSTAVPGDAFSDMFRIGKMRRSQGNTEGIWIFQADNRNDLPGAIGGNAQHFRVWGGFYSNGTGILVADSLGGRGIGRLRLNNWVLHGLYPAGDMRNSKYTIKRQFWYNDPTKSNYRQKVVAAGLDTLNKIHPYTLKWGFYDVRNGAGQFPMDRDLPLMRLGETYLLLAEAQFKQGNLPGAATSINELRTRANAPLVTAADITMDFILDERVRELVGEENRRMTLMRTGTLVSRINLRNPPIAGNPLNINITGLSTLAAGQKILLPIPQSEIDLNKDASLRQNAGY